ncbi:hypothetical protein RB595_003886 [Gaeumannomyces hyphopodioides]
MKLSKSIVSAALMAAAASAHPVMPVEDVKEAGLVARQRGGCADIYVAFARGTTELGALGVVVGPPLSAALRSAAGSKSTEVEGVNYPAAISGFLVGGDPGGSATMAQMVTSKAAACPNTKIVMAGYSQGGQLVHNAAKQLSPNMASRVSAAVIFGDPKNGEPVAQIPASRTMVICNTGDNICSGGILILPPHLTYGADAGKAARFIAAQSA